MRTAQGHGVVLLKGRGMEEDKPNVLSSVVLHDKMNMMTHGLKKSSNERKPPLSPTAFVMSKYCNSPKAQSPHS